MGKQKSKSKPKAFYDMMQTRFPDMSKAAIRGKLKRGADIVFLEVAETVMKELKKRKAKVEKELSIT